MRELELAPPALVPLFWLGSALQDCPKAAPLSPRLPKPLTADLESIRSCAPLPVLALKAISRSSSRCCAGVRVPEADEAADPDPEFTVDRRSDPMEALLLEGRAVGWSLLPALAELDWLE